MDSFVREVTYPKSLSKHKFLCQLSPAVSEYIYPGGVSLKIFTLHLDSLMLLSCKELGVEIESQGRGASLCSDDRQNTDVFSETKVHMSYKILAKSR